VRESQTRHHQSLDRFGFVFEHGAKAAVAHAAMCEPMRKLVYESAVPVPE
jgi:hypothetical protein